MNSRVFTFMLLVLSVLPGCGSSSGAQAQNPSQIKELQEDDVVRVNTLLVTVPVSVKSRDGGFISNLRRADFHIFEDGVEQEIAHFETADQPFTVLLMLDISDSTKIELKDIQNAASAFVNQLQPNDRAQVIAFDKSVVTLTEVTGDRQALSAAIRHVSTGGGTSLYDAMQMAMTINQKRIAGRQAIVILTDGIDTSSGRASYDSTMRLADSRYALIYPVQYDSARDVLGKQLSSENNGFGATIYTTATGEPVSKAFERGTRYLQMIAQVSGGRFQYAAGLKDLEDSFARIAEELRQQYGLGYYPRDRVKKGKRRIKITVNAPGDVVHARDSYTYNPGNP
jgi:Ca-activated chloride channel family protein